MDWEFYLMFGGLAQIHRLYDGTLYLCFLNEPK
jgi:hypothetical protein